MLLLGLTASKEQTLVLQCKELDSTNNLNDPANGFFHKLPKEISDR